MTSLLVGLTVYSAAVTVFGPRVMSAFRRWQCEAPRLGLVLWTMLTASWVVSVVSIGLAATAQLSGGLGLAGLLRACLRALLTVLGARDPAEAPAAVALVGCLVVVGRLVAVTGQHTWRTRRDRRSHRRTVSASATRTMVDERPITVVATEAPAAYCVPGRVPTIVLTTGAMRRLSRPELDAVIAHEVAHLRDRHHLCLQWATILRQAFPFVPVLREAPRQIARLVEWAADDAAGGRYGNRVVARALAVMATAARDANRVPDTVLTAAGTGVPQRVRRMLRTPTTARSIHWPIRAALILPLLTFVAAGILLIPAATADPTPLCANPTTVQTSK